MNIRSDEAAIRGDTSAGYRLTRKGHDWHIVAGRGAGAATDAAWVSLGGCPSQIVAVRVWLALMARRGR